MKWLFYSIFLILPYRSSAQTFRTDLQNALSSALCQDSPIVPATPELWQLKVYETQMDASWVRNLDEHLVFTDRDLTRLAQEQAQAKQHQGFAYGICSPKKAWILSTPAAAPLSHWRQGRLDFDINPLREHCETVALHYAKASHGGIPRELIKVKSRQVETLSLQAQAFEPGTVSLTCYPVPSKRQGPELWSLVPIHSFETEVIPFFSKLNRDDKVELIQWIQDLRTHQGLSTLKTDIDALRSLASQLVLDTSIRHPHAQLLDQRRILRRKHIEILGENRVKAISNRQMAWLLWYSPTHRQLLLHREAGAIGFEMSRLAHEKLLVLVLAKI